jgi:hypothetical protein
LMGLAGTGYYGDLRHRAIEICCPHDMNKVVAFFRRRGAAER